MSQRTVIAKVTTAEGCRDQALAAFEAVVTAAKEEPGTLEYRMYADRRDPNVIWFYEVYESKEAMQTHLASEAMRKVGAAMADLLVGQPEMAFVELQAAKG